jgi:hypothetical protein
MESYILLYVNMEILYLFGAWVKPPPPNKKKYYLLTPWCRMLFEKLIVTQLVKKYPAFFMEQEGSLP